MAHPAQIAKARLRMRIKPVAESILRSGHPWLFADSIREQNREGTPGELAIIYDRQDKFLAVGLYDPGSPIRVRILHSGKPVVLDEAWWNARYSSALERRKGIATAETTGLRLINGESDGWPGLVLDRYGDTLVLKLYTSAWIPYFDLIVALIKDCGTPSPLPSPTPSSAPSAKSASEAGEALRRTGPGEERRPEARVPARIVLRLSRNIQKTVGALGGKKDGDIVLGQPLQGSVIFSESGLRFEADVLLGQKTGFFLDQRENRRKVEQLSRGRRVLNAFSFTGGFSVYAARGGALEVTDLDISSHALAGSERNFALNREVPGVAASRHRTIQANAFEWLAGRQEERFGLIILDPPSLAKRETERAGAIEAYQKLAQAGIALLEPGGVLVACSCSAHVTADEFFAAVRGATAKSKRTFSEIETTRHTPDHPATFAAAEYLKAIYLRF